MTLDARAGSRWSSAVTRKRLPTASAIRTWTRHLPVDRPSARLSNPISSQLAVMRQSLWPGLAQALSHNLSRQQDRVRLFEIGCKVYSARQ